MVTTSFTVGKAGFNSKICACKKAVLDRKEKNKKSCFFITKKFINRLIQDQKSPGETHPGF
jgi:hypothetical protein